MHIGGLGGGKEVKGESRVSTWGTEWMMESFTGRVNTGSEAGLRCYSMV